MKILHVIPSISPLRGGPSYAVVNMVNALRDRGVEVEIATTNDNGSGEKTLDVPFGERTEYNGVPVYFFSIKQPSGSGLTQDKGFLFSWPLTQWLWQHIRDYDLVHTHYLFSYASTCAAWIARQQNVPYIRRTIGQLAPWALAQSQRKKQVYSFLIERQLLNGARAILCTSDGEADDARNYGITAPTATIPLGVNLPVVQPDAGGNLRSHYDIPNDASVVLFLSRLHYKKRPDLFLEAMARVRKTYPQAYLLLAGSGDEEYIAELTALGERLRLTDYTRFTGFVTGDEKDLVLQGADMFVLPSFSENFGIAVVEAMAAKLPVVITPGVQISDSIATANAGLIVDGEIDAVATGIAELLGSVDRRQELGENGYSLAKTKYSWSAIATSLEELYGNAIGTSAKKPGF
ncbi:glycosyltransferase [Roseofilum casamattae]|uniref:Glycosyltransferase n=1 Tax=Roseofilum casamattae BLCC-M143 TaxID=3022442 RepID=A0ABT7C0U5_9CYAN|nr:glycosyltransferase [Roseofilum casamattae]MDJ1185067.1 glycosyltransferase [Roseofilum casamattae BLCC-M143]